MNWYYDPLDDSCKSEIGAIVREKNLTLNVYWEEGGEEQFSAEICFLILQKDGKEPEFLPMDREEDHFTITLKFHRAGLYFYHFEINHRIFGCGKLRKGTFAANCEWQITVHEKEFKTPDWFKGGILYQIFPDRFRKAAGTYPIGKDKILRQWGEQPYFRENERGVVLNNDFFGGNLNGIREEIGYLQSLGVTAIYLNPIFKAYSNHRYDTGDYLEIDELLGTMGDFESLIEEAEASGIKVILDGVFNHTGNDSRYFNEFGNYPSIGAYQSKDSPYADWYNFRTFPSDYECWWGIKTLPALNEASPTYQEFLFGEEGVLRFWLKKGIGGFRLDVADELPDFFLKKLRKTVKEENPEALILGEVWEDASNKISYDVRREYLQGAELDSVMNYPLKNSIIEFVKSANTLPLRETIAMLLDNYPKASLNCLMNSLGTHDTPRILTVLGGKECKNREEMARTFLNENEKKNATSLLKFAVLLAFTLPGVPCIYYGDEIGMEGYADPFCRSCFCWEKIDSELTSYYRRLGQIRTMLKSILKDGDYHEIFADLSCFVFQRKKGKAAVYIYVNRSGRSYQLDFKGRFREYITDQIYEDHFTIAPNSCGIMGKNQYYV